jgi:hypothetical protein
MATRTIANGGGNWNATGTWVEGIVPTASDDVVATATSGTVTITAAAACRSINLTNYVSTLTHNAFTLTIGTSTANGTTALVFPASGWTYALSDVKLSAIAFSSTVTSTTLTVDFGAQTTGNVSFSAATTSGHQLVNHGFTCGATATVTHTQGTFNTNGQTCSWGGFNSNNSNTRALTLGASAITLTSTATAWDTTTATSMTFTPGTSTITIGGSGSTATLTAVMNAGSLTYNNVVFAVTGTALLTALNGSSPTFANLTVTGPANAGAILSLGTNITVTTTLTLNGNNANTQRLLVNSTVVGTQRTITSNANSFTNLDLQDISGAGSGSWSLAAITGNSGNCLGNSGITFTTGRTLYWVGNSGSWSTANKWSLSSGGTANQSNPLAQDNIIFDSHSFSGTGQTVTANIPRLGTNIDFSAVTNNPTLSANQGTPQYIRLYGNLTLAAGMTHTSPAFNFYMFEGRGSSSLTSAGVTLTASQVVANCPGGTLTLADNVPASNGLNLYAGTMTASGNVTTSAWLASNNTVAKVLNMGSGTWTLTGTGFVWNTATGAQLTINAQTSTIVISNTSATSKTFNANSGFTYNILTITGDNVAILDGNTFATLNVDNAALPNGLTLPSGATQTITSSFTTNGSAGNLAILKASTSGTAANLSMSSGTVAVDYMSLKDSRAIGGAAWYAGAHSTNVSGNSGWIFEGIPNWTGGWGIPIQ